MLKKMMNIVVLIIICVIVIITCKLVFFLYVGADSVKIFDVQVTSNFVSFKYRQTDTGYCLRSYDYYIDDNGTMFLKFQGTMLYQLSLDETIRIDEVHDVKKIIITDGMNNVTVWTEKNNR